MRSTSTLTRSVEFWMMILFLNSTPFNSIQFNINFDVHKINPTSIKRNWIAETCFCEDTDEIRESVRQWSAHIFLLKIDFLSKKTQKQSEGDRSNEKKILSKIEHDYVMGHFPSLLYDFFASLFLCAWMSFEKKVVAKKTNRICSH